MVLLGQNDKHWMGWVYSLTYGDGKFVAGTGGGNSVWTSDDGITWTERQTLDGFVYVANIR